VAEAVYATLHTNSGAIRLELFPNHAPKTVRNFVELAEGTKQYTDPRTGQPGSGPYYDGTISHRVISGFMVQMGDPTGTGRGGPGYNFADEASVKVVDAIANTPTGAQDRPVQDVVIERVEIERKDG
jgi:peptidyl-prolyl cis-trans isomerase A (cyclophilin A)